MSMHAIQSKHMHIKLEKK